MKYSEVLYLGWVVTKNSPSHASQPSRHEPCSVISVKLTKIMCYREKFLWLGVPQLTALTPEINLSQYAIEIKFLTLKDQTSYLIPDGWSRSPLSFSIFILNWSITSSTSKQYKHIIFHGVRSILAYIINNVKAFDIIPWIKYSFKYTSLDRKRYFY